MHIKSVAFATAIALAAASPAAAQTVGVASSAQGSFTFGVASAIAKVVSENTDIQMRVQPSGGSNIFMPQVDAGIVDFGMATDYEVWLSVNGKLIYDKPHKNLRVVAMMVPLTPGMFVRKDSPYHSFKEAVGKRVSSGFTSQKIIGEVIKAHLANAGLSYDDVKQVPAPNVVRAADDFMQGKTDFLFFALGSGAVLKAGAKVGGLRFLSLDDSDAAWGRLQKVIPMAYQMHVNPSKRFYGVEKPSVAMAYDLAISTYADMSEDTVYKITKAIYGHKEDMRKVFPVLAGFDQKRMGKKSPLPFHPGAIKFYKEMGVWQVE